MAKRTLPTPEELRKVLLCDAQAGKLFWRERDKSLFAEGVHTAETRCKMWNSRFAGKEAFTASGLSRYYTGAVFGRNYYVHRVIWAMHYGEWPEADIDHINHDRQDNRVKNLREATGQENSRNMSLSLSNTSGHTGVTWRKCRGKWVAQMSVDGKVKYLGIFTDIKDAISARNDANIKHGFHTNHGK